ncbi:MAG TPA: ArsR family transcriptional regulator [Thermoprotei archaeon]|nr:ArsR family transcriptional regulator [Thermoprotei archaeon]
MLIKIRRKLLPEEMLERIKYIEKRYGEERILEKKAEESSQILDIYMELISLRNAYMEYEEDGESFYLAEEEISNNIARRLLSEKMIKILEEILKGVDSISDLARKTGRSVSNIDRDLKFLEKNKIIGFWKKGKRKIPYLLLKEIVIQI